MKIVHAQLYPLEVPMLQPIKMAGETLTHAHTVLLRVVDESGREGWGETSAAPLMTGETLSSLVASTEYLVGRLMGVEIATPTQICARQDAVLYANASAKACHETAVMDVFAQSQGVPLYQLLAGHALPTEVRLDMLHMLASGDVTREIEEARSLRQAGYRQWKIKVGAGNTELDVQRVRALCHELRGDVVSADANQALSIEAAHAIARAGAETGLSFLEQPYRVGMMNEMTALHQASGVALCADESIQTLDDILAHHHARAAQGVSLKLIKLGGTQALVAAGRACLAWGMKINLACKVAETTISAAATAHAGFALGQVAWGFSMSNRYLAHDVCAQPLAPIAGAVSSAQFTQAGLGFAPEASRLREFASRRYAMIELKA